jgi:hypothetical protein
MVITCKRAIKAVLNALIIALNVDQILTAWAVLMANILLAPFACPALLALTI